MINFNNLEDNLIIICPNKKKDELVKITSQKFPFKHIKFIDKKEIIDNAYFKYDYDAIIYLVTKYNYSYSIAKEVLENLSILGGYNDKINQLNLIYLDLKSNNLLKFNSIFKYLFNDKKTYIYGYSKKDNELLSALDKLEIKYQFLDDDSKEYQHNVYRFKTIDDEVKSAFIEMLSLVNQGVSLNNIYLYQISDEYKNIIKKYAKYHNIKIDGLGQTYLYDSPIYKRFIKYLESDSITNSYQKLYDEVKNDPLGVMEKLSNIIVDTIDLEKEIKNGYIEFLNYVAKNTKLKEIKYDNCLKICDYNNVINDDCYVYILGFSLDSYPKIYKDTDFYSDNEKEFLGKNTSKTKSLIDEGLLSDFIKKTKNLYISYKEKQGKKEYYPSLLIKKLNMNVLEKDISNIRYSQKLSKLEVSDCIDMNLLYAIDNKHIKSYSKEELAYNTYKHDFKGIDYYNSWLIKLSPTSINEYNTCPFKYYTNRVLKVGEFENTFALKLGNVFHLILQDSLTKDINLDDYKEIIEKEFETYKERVLFYNLLPQVIDVINKNKEFINNSHFKNAIAEKDITINIDSNSVLTGKIDKVLFNDIDKELIVVDYKTGSFHYDKKKNKYGIDLQLPIYSLLLSKEFPQFENVGMYIQNVCLPKKDLADEKIIPYTLDGLTLKDDFKVKRIDNTLGDLDCDGNEIKKSKFLSSIKLKKDLTLDAYSGTSSEEYESLKEIALEMVNKTLDNIRNSKFDISPIRFNSQKDLPCKYCDYKDVCFMKYSDVRNINLNGGDDDETI